MRRYARMSRSSVFLPWCTVLVACDLRAAFSSWQMLGPGKETLVRVMTLSHRQRSRTSLLKKKARDVSGTSGMKRYPAKAIGKEMIPSTINSLGKCVIQLQIPTVRTVILTIAIQQSHPFLPDGIQPPSSSQSTWLQSHC